MTLNVATTGIRSAAPAGPASSQVQDRTPRAAARAGDVDDNDDQLAAYNAYLARINNEPFSSTLSAGNQTRHQHQDEKAPFGQDDSDSAAG